MRKLILVYGDLAAGKTTLSDKLAQRFSVAVAHKDNIKEYLADTIGFSNREENLKLSIASVQTLVYFFQTVAPAQNDLILESNFHSEELQKLQNIATQYNYKVLSIVLQGDEDTLFERYLHRAFHENRHKAHLSAGLENKDAYKNYIRRTRVKEPIGSVLQIDATNLDFLSDENLFDKVGAFLSD